jgi:hypothetical protein
MGICPARVLPAPQAHWLELRLVAIVAKFLNAIGNLAPSESLAAIGAILFGMASGSVGWDEEDSFHRGPPGRISACGRAFPEATGKRR